MLIFASTLMVTKSFGIILERSKRIFKSSILPARNRRNSHLASANQASYKFDKHDERYSTQVAIFLTVHSTDSSCRGCRAGVEFSFAESAGLDLSFSFARLTSARVQVSILNFRPAVLTQIGYETVAHQSPYALCKGPVLGAAD